MKKHSEFIEFYLAVKAIKVAPLTLESYKRCLCRYLPPEGLVSDFGLFEAQEAILLMNGLSAATQRRNYVCLRQYYTFAVKYGEAKTNPFDGVEVPKVPKTVDGLRKRVYYNEELHGVFSGLRREPLMWRLYITLALDSGCRRGEILSLRWNDIDFSKNSFEVSKSLYRSSGSTQTKEPKGRRSRNIVFGDCSKRLFRAFCVSQKRFCVENGVIWCENGYIFSDNGGKNPLNPCTPSHWWRRFLKRHRLPLHRLHDLRHTCASRLLDSGVDVRTVCDRLGHASLSTTMIYLHNDNGQQAAAAMDNLIKKAATL